MKNKPPLLKLQYPMIKGSQKATVVPINEQKNLVSVILAAQWLDQPFVYVWPPQILRAIIYPD